MKLWIERCYPIGLSIGAALAWLTWCRGPINGPHDLLATAVTLSSIVVGFLATAMSIVLAAPDSSLMKDLRSSGYVHDLVHYLREPFIVGLALAAFSLSGYVVSEDAAKGDLYVGVIIWLAAWMLGGLLRIAIVLMHFLKYRPKQRKVAKTGHADDLEVPAPLLPEAEHDKD